MVLLVASILVFGKSSYRDIPQIAASPTPAAQNTGTSTEAENALPGFPGWRIRTTGLPHEIEGWADSTSVLTGSPVRVAVSTTAPTFMVSVFRMGWYGGAQARLVQKLGPFTGEIQTPSLYTPSTRTYYTDWHSSFTVATTGFTPGAYLLRLETPAGPQRFVPVTIKGPSAAGRMVLVNAVTTWQAYNEWGGASLYHGTGGEADFDGRSYATSFDRPYSEGEGAADFIGNELPAIALAEKLGLPLQYVTDVDLHVDPTVLGKAHAVVALGHDEYWSNAMRATVTKARDHGVNVAFLGANAVFRRIRLESSATRPFRLEVSYKRTYPDPMSHVHPEEVTTDWREPPVPLAESSLVGTLYECNPAKAPMAVTNPTSWLWDGVAAAGALLPDLIGPEYDRVNPGFDTPSDIEVLTHSPVTCRGVHSYSDSAYYTVPSGAGVFSAGTGSWVVALQIGHAFPCTAPVNGCAALTEVTSRLLRAFAAGPAAKAHPTHPNLEALHAFAGDAIAAGQQATSSPTAPYSPTPTPSLTTSPTPPTAPSPSQTPTPTQTPSDSPGPLPTLGSG